VWSVRGGLEGGGQKDGEALQEVGVRQAVGVGGTGHTDTLDHTCVSNISKGEIFKGGFRELKR
jgi:hypothetical protein